MNTTGNPQFVEGDTRKALRVTVKDDGDPVDVSAGQVRLYAKGVENDDKLGTVSGDTWEGVLGTFPNGGTDGVVEFDAIGSLCDIGERASQEYVYEVMFVDSYARSQLTPPSEQFTVYKPLSGVSFAAALVPVATVKELFPIRTVTGAVTATAINVPTKKDWSKWSVAFSACGIAGNSGLEALTLESYDPDAADWTVITAYQVRSAAGPDFNSVEFILPTGHTQLRVSASHDSGQNYIAQMTLNYIADPVI